MKTLQLNPFPSPSVRPKPRAIGLLAAAILSFAPGQLSASDWPMLARDAARRGATPDELRPPFERKWYRLFPDEGIMSGVQPVVSGDRVLVGTLRGVLHAMDAATGHDVWTFQAGGAILHTCAAADGQVFFGSADGKICAVRLADGRLAWTVQTGAGVWNAPLTHEGVVVIGSRDGKLYTLDAASGGVKWAAVTGGPLLCSPALDARTGRLFIGSEDMHVYAFDFGTGAPVWRSDKLPGVSLRGYHPVIAPDGSVMITTAPGASLDRMASVLMDMVKEVFGDFASWRHKKEENTRLRAENFQLMSKPGTHEAQLNYLRKRLTEEPALQTFFVLDPKTGKQKFVAPIVYSESMNGPGAPALVLDDGKVIVKYQALLRSRYEHYSPFLNVGYLGTATGQLTPIMDQSRTYGWHDSLLLVHDEQCQLSAAGRVLLNTHQDNVNGLDLDTLQGYGEPFARNIHEPQPGEAVGLWARQLRSDPLLAGKEWLPRGTAVYGGGSVLDVPVSIAGDSFYFLPTHEINAGVAVIAYRKQSGEPPAPKAATTAEKLTEDEWAMVQRRPWDWDTLGLPRLDHVLKALPGRVAGTRQQPLTNEAAAAVARIADAELDAIIWEAPSLNRATGALSAELARAVRELISADWPPLVFPSGKHPEEAYRFFNEPTETLYTLALAYPHLDDSLRRAVQQRVAVLREPGGPLDGPTGQATYRVARVSGLFSVRQTFLSAGSGDFPVARTNTGLESPANRQAGKPALQAPGGTATTDQAPRLSRPPLLCRSLYDPPENLLRVNENFTRTELARLYPLWLWARVSDDWAHLETHWPRLRELANRPPNKLEEDCRNGHVAGLIAYCRIARRMKDDAAVGQGVAAARKAMRERLAYEFAHPRGGLIYQVPTGRAIFSRWEHLTPEVGRLCAAFAKPTHQHLMDVYVDHHRPTWWLAWNVELMWRNESPCSFPTMSAEIFAARAWILGEPAEKLRTFLDLPWCKGDEYYIQKLALVLSAAERTGG